MSIKGQYFIYEDGKEIARSNNVVTKFGKRFITNLISGSLGFQTKAIVVGIGSSQATENDTRLEFEFYKSPVQIGSPDIDTDPITGISTYGVIFKTTLPNDVSGLIKELGLYPTQSAGFNDYSNKYISSFENNTLWLDEDSNSPDLVKTPAPRIGEYLFEVVAPPVTSPSTYSVKEYSLNTDLDISGYSINDSFSLAFTQADTNLDYVYARFYSSDSDYYEARFAGESSIVNPNKIVNESMSTFFNGINSQGSPVSNSINKITIGIKSKTIAGTTVYLDGLRINDEDSFDPIYGLISRSVLSAGINKIAGRQLDIEYRLGLSF